MFSLGFLRWPLSVVWTISSQSVHTRKNHSSNWVGTMSQSSILKHYEGKTDKTDIFKSRITKKASIFDMKKSKIPKHEL